MPLVEAVLANKLQALFESPGNSIGACARAWADVMRDYAATIVPPSTTAAAASDVLAAALVPAFGTFGAAAPGMESAFAAFAVSVGAGMAGFTPVPPPGAIDFAAQAAQPPPETNAEAAAQFAAKIHAWLTTGSSTLVAPPNTVTPWS